MQMPETPDHIADLDLLKRLDAYAEGTATYLVDKSRLGREAREACRKFYSDLLRLDDALAPLLNKVNAKEMDAFTMHDAKHARKVAHLMWHILTEERRQLLSPPEIGLLVSAALIHDLGMFLSPEEREARLLPESELWDILEIDEATRIHFKELRTWIQSEVNPARLQRLERQLFQAQEAVLCRDTRERHATLARYNAIINELRQQHQREPTKLPDIDTCLSFGGDSFLEKLIEICVSHNESEEALLTRDSNQPEIPKFGRDYPVGSSSADLLLVASALRLSDILDFDRERTPTVLYSYFLPGTVDPESNRSTLEWEKHLAISNWHVEHNTIVFKGQCKHHVVHHAIVTFCDEIAETIAATKATCLAGETGFWPFVLPTVVKVDIHSQGYHYLPYRFELDDERIYRLLMSGAIYERSLDALRELLQNSVDACKLRDALTRLTSPEVTPNFRDRIVVEYVEPTHARPYPVLTVQDSGSGMDEWAITHWFLKVGRSYYSSADFNSHRAQLRKSGLDFAPVSEFGIGFLSCFLLGDQIEVETAMWEPIRADTKKRVLDIHGPSRLIRLAEHANTGISRLRGTRVSIRLLRGSPSKPQLPPSFGDVEAYLHEVCFSLPYTIKVRHVCSTQTDESYIDPKPLTVHLPCHFTEVAIRIPVNDTGAGLSGEIALVHPGKAAANEEQLAKESAIYVADAVTSASWRHRDRSQSALIRGGFRIGGVPGLPNSYRVRFAATAILEMRWENQDNRRYTATNLSRSALAAESKVEHAVIRNWLSWLLEHVDELPEGLIDSVSIHGRLMLNQCSWLERFDGLTVYRLASNGWYSWLRSPRPVPDETISAWEASYGDTLPLGIFRDDLDRKLLDLVLPLVSKLSMAQQGRFYVSPPIDGWKEILKGCKDFVSRPIAWGPYVEYIGGIEDLLYYEYPSCDQLNGKYRGRVDAEFSACELPTLVECLRVLADNKQKQQVEMSSESISVARRAQETLGDLEIGEISGSWRIDSYKLH